MKRVLIVVDMQNDFVSGALGTPEARAIEPAVAARIRSFDGEVFATLDTHGPDYLRTQEGQRLPVPHCLAGTAGHALTDGVRAALAERVGEDTLRNLTEGGEKKGNREWNAHRKHVRDYIYHLSPPSS